MVLHRDNGPRRAIALREATIHARNDAADDELLAVMHLVVEDLGQRGIRLRGQRLLEAIERVAGNVQAQHFALEGKFVFTIPIVFRNVQGKGVRGRVVFSPADSSEEIELSLIRGLLGGLHRIHRVLVDEHEALARVVQVIEGAGLNQRFCHALGAGGELDLVQVIAKGGKRALVVAGFDDGFHHFRADIADSAHAEADILSYRLEVLFGLVDGRR